MTTRDWDAPAYEAVSGFLDEWAADIAARLGLRGDETVLDAGCGTGRLTRRLLDRLPRGRVVAVDGAPAMVRAARGAFAAEPRVRVRQADLTRLRLEAPVDAVGSSAVMHWVADHDALFTRLHAVLRPGGRLVALGAGEGHQRRMLTALDGVAAGPPYAAHLDGWSGPWRFASAPETAAVLERAGFADVDVRAAERSFTAPDPVRYLGGVALSEHVQRLPGPLRQPFLADVVAAMGAEPVFSHMRLEVSARRPVA